MKFLYIKLVTLATTLNCTTDKLLEDIVRHQDTCQIPQSPKYFAIFISLTKTTYCTIVDAKTKNKKTAVYQFSIGCGADPNNLIAIINNTAQELLKKDFNTNVDYKDIAVFASVQQYEGAANRAKLQKLGDFMFAQFVIESDAITNYNAIFKHNTGISITINNGNCIVYKSEADKRLIKIQGYGFPISDIAGSQWIGCEAIKHTINVQENIEPNSLLSDKILAHFKNDISYLAENIMSDAGETYEKASLFVKELIFEDNIAKQIVKNSTQLLLERVQKIDANTKTKLDIALAGDWAALYANFFPKTRLIHCKANVPT